MANESLETRLRRDEVLEILRHPNRIQADDVVKHFLKDVKYSTDVVKEILGGVSNALEESLEERMFKMGVIGGEGIYIWDEQHYEPVVFVGQMKPKGLDHQSQAAVNYGYVSPKGLEFSNKLYRKAESEKKKLLLLVNTFGGAANNEAALKGQSWLISDNIRTLLSLDTSIVSIILGEGGSGGALQGQIGDKNLMLEYADYAVIAPQHAATILKYPVDDPNRIAKATELLKPMAQDMLELKVIDRIVPEFTGGAHLEKSQEYKVTMKNITEALNWAFKELGRGVSHSKKLRSQRIKRAFQYGETKGFLDKIGICKKPSPSIYKPIPISDRIPKLELILTPHDPFRAISEQLHREKLNKWGIRGEIGIHCLGKIFYPPVNDALDYRGVECGWVLTEKEFEENYKSCPNCGWGERLSYKEWIRLLTDKDSFEEFDQPLKFEDFKSTIYHTKEYLNDLEKAREKTGLHSAALTGRAAIEGKNVVIYQLAFEFWGGTLGASEGEEFYRTAQHAKKEKIPLIGVFTSGGVRMEEGTLGLKQMEKNVAVTYMLKRAGIPFYSVLVSPCTAGILGSNASQGDIIIAEKYGAGNIFSFAGPRVVSYGGGKLDDYAMASDILKLIDLPNGRKAVDETVLRKDIKSTLAKYVHGGYFRKS